MCNFKNENRARKFLLDGKMKSFVLYQSKQFCCRRFPLSRQLGLSKKDGFELNMQLIKNRGRLFSRRREKSKFGSNRHKVKETRQICSCNVADARCAKGLRGRQRQHERPTRSDRQPINHKAEFADSRLGLATSEPQPSANRRLFVAQLSP